MAATAGLALQAASLFGTAQGQRQQAASARTQGNYVGAIADQNAVLDEQQGRDATARGEETAGRIGLGARQLVGSQRAAQAAQGLDVNTGTPATLQDETQALSEFDKLTARNNAAREAWGYSVNAANERAAGTNARLAGENEGNALQAKAYSTLLTGSAGLADQWRQNPPTFGGGWRRSRAAPTMGHGAGYE